MIRAHNGVKNGNISPQIKTICKFVFDNSSIDTDLRKQIPALSQKVEEGLKNWKPRINHEFDQEHYQIIDFFSGCGGMSLGFNVFNSIYPFYKLIGGCDIDRDASRSYEKNFKVPCIQQDIKELLDEKNLSNFLKQLPDYDSNKPLLIIGCPPCQGFTSQRKKNWNKLDERNDLVGIFAKIAVKLNPICIVMENVPEILSKKYWHYYEGAKRIFEKSGYTVHQQIYNTASFGVPQERYRALIVAMKKDFLLPEPIIPDSKFKTVEDAIGSLPPVSPGEKFVRDAYHYCANHKQSTIDVIKSVPKDGGNRPKGIGPKCLDKVKGYTDVYGRLSWNKPAITITQYARNPASGRYTHPDQDRGLTIREAASLQSFPFQFEFTGNFDSMFKQIGEAVPPLFAGIVAIHLFIEIISDPPRNEERIKQNYYVNEPINNSYSGYSSLTSSIEKQIRIL